jgi:hypothetical protein
MATRPWPAPPPWPPRHSAALPAESWITCAAALAVLLAVAHSLLRTDAPSNAALPRRTCGSPDGIGCAGGDAPPTSRWVRARSARRPLDRIIRSCRVRRARHCRSSAGLNLKQQVPPSSAGRRSRLGPEIAGPSDGMEPSSNRSDHRRSEGGEGYVTCERGSISGGRLLLIGESADRPRRQAVADRSRGLWRTP